VLCASFSVILLVIMMFLLYWSLARVSSYCHHSNAHPKMANRNLQTIGQEHMQQEDFCSTVWTLIRFIWRQSCHMYLTPQDTYFTLQVMLMPSIQNHRKTLMKDSINLPLAYLQSEYNLKCLVGILLV